MFRLRDLSMPRLVQFKVFLILPVLLFMIPDALAESFSIHLIHPDNDHVGLPKADTDLRDYEKFIDYRDGKEKVLWVSKTIELGIGDLDEAKVNFNKPPFRLEDLFGNTQEMDKLIQ